MHMTAANVAVYISCMRLRGHLLLVLLIAAVRVCAQADTLAAPWLDREFRYWKSDPGPPPGLPAVARLSLRGDATQCEAKSERPGGSKP